MDAPVFRVDKGAPTAEELAVLVAVLTTRNSPDGHQHPAPAPSAWSAPSGQMRPTLRPGRDAWRRSGLPH